MTDALQIAGENHGASRPLPLVTSIEPPKKFNLLLLPGARSTAGLPLKCSGEPERTDRPPWLMLFNREEQARTEDLRHTTLATARLRFLFLAAKIVRHAGCVLVRYSDHYTEKGTIRRLMDRLRAIVPSGNRFAPVLASVLRL